MTLIHKSDYAEYFRIESYILKVVITTKNIDKTVITQIWKDRDLLAEKFNLTELINSHSVTYRMSREAKVMSLEHEATGKFNCLAIIQKNPIIGFLVNVFMKLSPSKTPMKSFPSLDAAVYWIHDNYNTSIRKSA